jgi:nitrite reductase/ring-hydroxylating ferredoxin subunit
MTDESQRDQFATRRCVLLGAGALGAAGVLTACSTAAVPYDANGNGQAPSSPTSPSASDTPMASGSGGMSGAAGGMESATASGTAKSGGQMQMGTLLGMTADIPVGGGKVFTAAKVVVTQPAKGHFKAFSAVCTHVGCLCNQVADGTINCPCHGSKFKIADGSVTAGPADAPLATAKIHVADGKIMLT